MGKFNKPGKVVLVLHGRFAGRKGIIVKVGLFTHSFNH
jgi:ribosomal protein L14E/L6E/L27E